MYAKRSRQNYRKLMAQRKQWPAIAATDREHASQARCVGRSQDTECLPPPKKTTTKTGTKPDTRTTQSGSNVCHCGPVAAPFMAPVDQMAMSDAAVLLMCCCCADIVLLMLPIAPASSCDADADAPGTASESEKQRIERKFVVSQNDFRSYRARWKATNAGEVAAARDHRVQVLKVQCLRRHVRPSFLRSLPPKPAQQCRWSIVQQCCWMIHAYWRDFGGYVQTWGCRLFPKRLRRRRQPAWPTPPRN